MEVRQLWRSCWQMWRGYREVDILIKKYPTLKLKVKCGVVHVMQLHFGYDRVMDVDDED